MQEEVETLKTVTYTIYNCRELIKPVIHVW